MCWAEWKINRDDRTVRAYVSECFCLLSESEEKSITIFVEDGEGGVAATTEFELSLNCVELNLNLILATV